MYGQIINVQNVLVGKPGGKRYLGNTGVNWKMDERNGV
jgi:hypothetical protein